jgi:hypothetical protein
MAIRPHLDENYQNKTTRKLKYLLDFFIRTNEKNKPKSKRVLFLLR